MTSVYPSPHDSHPTRARAVRYLCGMGRYDALMNAAKRASHDRVWTKGVELARSGAVRGISDDGDEIVLEVETQGRALPHEVYLWPDDPDWGCDCKRSDPICIHVVAALLCCRTQTGALPKPKAVHAVRLQYRFTSQKNALAVERILLYQNGTRRPLTGPLAREDVLVGRADIQAESLLVLQPAGPLSGEALRRLVQILGADADAVLDDEPIRLSAEPLPFEVRVTDAGEAFKVGLYRPPGIDRLFRGAALIDGVLRPTSHGQLNPHQRKMLLQGVLFRTDEVSRLVSDYLPRLREKIPVRIATERLPDEEHLQPRIQLHLKEQPDGLVVEPILVYGDPPVARVQPGGALQRLDGAIVPGRSIPAERAAIRTFESKMGITVGYRQLLPPERAASFLTERLPLHDGPVVGKVRPERFRISSRPVEPRLDVRQGEGGWYLDVSFNVDDSSNRGADPQTVLAAWSARRSVVPLLDGGYAPLPKDWLRRHGALLRELLDGRDASGKVQRTATAALVELLEETDGDVPPELRRLRAWLEGGEGLPDAPLPAGLRAELRPYQRAGFQWMRFLREMDLSGILADDMGLGKTVQALAAILDAGGSSLVVAPTSVVQNWVAEAARFTPDLRVNLYHGPGRSLDGEADLTITTYALLRLDLDLLKQKRWTYVILDEAQTIKNPASQTARAACALNAQHRLALTGTPVENRLEELWSLFRFLMPGLLGTLRTFKERFVRPIENGDAKARRALRARVRPYVLRRMKAQVATELPPLTEQVLRCELSPAQRQLYDTVRLAAREDVQRALRVRGTRGATFQVLEALLRMRQACCDPALLPGHYDDSIGSAKLDRLEDLLVEVVLEEHKALVFSQWTSLLDRVEPRLRKLGIAWVRLDGATRDRQQVIERFQAEDGPPVFLLSLKAGGTGLNLTAADYVIHLDPWWNPAVEQQATDRAHRIGQTKPVVSYKLIARGTVEERILELQASKKDLADAALGSEGGFLKALDADELRALFEETP